MFFLSRPNQNAIAAFLSAQRNQTFSYAEVECTRKDAPNGYVADHNRIELSKGVDAFKRAKDAVRQWKMFDMPWIDLFWPDTPLQPGASVAVLISHLGFWSLNACKIIYLIDEHGPTEKFGFAYGTLTDHGERGEERLQSNSTPTKRSGTICSRFRDRGCWRDWLSHTRDYCRNALPLTPSWPCGRLCSPRKAQANSR